MSVGSQREACVVVAEDAGDGFDVYTVLESQGDEGVAEIVQADVGESSGFEDFVVNGGNGAGVVHAERDRGGEHVLDIRVLLMFRFEDVDGFL